MKKLKSILRWTVGILLGSYLTIILLLSLPFVQRWIGGIVADALSQQLQTKVQVGRVQVGLSGRLIVDDIQVWDKKGENMLEVARAGAKLDLLPLFEQKDIHINNALLFGAHAHLYQEHPDSSTNFQFVIDAFQSKDEEKKPMPHISIDKILVRHTTITFDQRWKEPRQDRFDPSHITLQDVNLAAQLHVLQDDSLSFTLRRLDFKEKCGFVLKSAQMKFSKGSEGFHLTDCQLTTPNSQLTLPKANINPNSRQLGGNISFDVLPSDFSAFYPKLSQLQNRLNGAASIDADSLQLNAYDIKLCSEDEAVSLDIPQLLLTNLSDSIPNGAVQLRNLTIKPEAMRYADAFTDEVPAKLNKLASVMGEARIEGSFSYMDGIGNAETMLTSALGRITLDGKMENKVVDAHISTDGFQLGHTLEALQVRMANQNDSTSLIGNLTFDADAEISLSNTSTKVLDGNVLLNIQELEFKGYKYHNLNLKARHRNGNYDIAFDAADPALTMKLQANAKFLPSHYVIQSLVDVDKFRPADMHLLKGGIHEVSMKVGINLAGEKLDNLSGDISIPHIIVENDEGTYTLSHIMLESEANGEQRNIRLQSPYLQGRASGVFDFRDLISYCQESIHHWIPGIVKAPTHKPVHCQADFSLKLTDATPLQRLAGIDLHFDKGPLVVKAKADSRQNLLNLEASAPQIGWGSENLLDFNYRTEGMGETMKTQVDVKRIMKQNPVQFTAAITTDNELLTTRISWDDKLLPATNGSIALRGNLRRDADKLEIDGEVLPTQLHISDTTWNIKPTAISFHNGVLDVENFRMTMDDDDRWLAIRGKASKDVRDTLNVDLKGIELSYIFDLAKIKPLMLSGRVNGSIFGTSLFSQPVAFGHVIVPGMHFNEADMGTCDAHLAWGATPGTLDINAVLEDTRNNARIKADGYLHLVKDPIQHMDLHFDCLRANAHFLKRYVGGIMEDVQGRATGNVRVYGSFKEVDLEGDVLVEEAAMTIPSLNVRYHVMNERVKMTPGRIEMKNVVGYDPMGGPHVPDHRGNIDGVITFEHFKNMRYNFNISGNNILAYNFPDFGDMPFCGVVYGTGNVQLSGSPGVTTIDIDARPDKGTQLTYKVASPETLTQSKFLTFIDHNDDENEGDDDHANEQVEEKPEGDMNIIFNLDITPDAEMRLLMDPTTDDYISLFGNSRMRCTYYNKGNFRMYGTYRVDHGTYRMSIQDVIRKDFQFRKDGTIVFGGSPFQGDLNLQAIYTVPSVSLNDLSARGTFSNSNVRVNCIMNLGGKAGEPRVTFDFDIPNVNEDEARMVRSLISTEEERNLQVIYLLGIGRFYTYDYTGTQAQSSTAMNSLLSSTISGQLNQMFTSMMGGNQNWNIGANLSTGDMGWSDMDVEGILSGRLLNNRLLINGNFGYRDNPVAASNFIGDFDLQWILNKQGSLILKAYSETNDRYFTKSALTTQGVGILLKKDFVHWRDLFRLRKKK